MWVSGSGFGVQGWNMRDKKPKMKNGFRFSVDLGDSPPPAPPSLLPSTKQYALPIQTQQWNRRRVWRLL